MTVSALPFESLLVTRGKAMPWFWVSPFLLEVRGLFSGPSWLSLHLYVVTDCTANVTVLASYPLLLARVHSTVLDLFLITYRTVHV